MSVELLRGPHYRDYPVSRDCASELVARTAALVETASVNWQSDFISCGDCVSELVARTTARVETASGHYRVSVAVRRCAAACIAVPWSGRQWKRFGQFLCWFVDKIVSNILHEVMRGLPT